MNFLVKLVKIDENSNMLTAEIANALAPGSLLCGGAYTYCIEQVLGQGSFGITYLSTTKVRVDGSLGNLETTMQVAVK